MKRIILGLFIILLIPSKTLALKCTESQIERFEKLAKQIQVTYDYQEKEDNVQFTIKFHNVHNDLYLIDYNTFDETMIYNDNRSGIITASNYQPGLTYTFEVVNKKSLCDLTIITKVTTTLPSYNKYYKDSLCDGIENYFLCQKWANVGTISYSDFKKGIESYRLQNKITEPVIDEDIEYSFWDKIRNFVADYYFYFVLVFVFFVGIVLFVKQKQKKDVW